MEPVWVQKEAEKCLSCFDPPCSASCMEALDPAGLLRTLKNAGSDAACARMTRACIRCDACREVCVRGRMDEPVNLPKLMSYLWNRKRGDEHE